MNSSSFYSKYIKKIYITHKAARYNAAQRVINILKHIPKSFVESKTEIPLQDQNKYTLFITTSRAKTVTRCPGSKGHLCCNYFTIDMYEGCPLGCSYCIMKSYLNFSPITVYIDIQNILQKIKQIINANQHIAIRIGTGEVGDSLFFDPLFNLSYYFIKNLARYRNVFFELKTKTHFVDHLLDIQPKGNAVIGFSLNPQDLISGEEGIASSLEQRLKAAHRILQSGYLVSFHFDPIILVKNWEEMYYHTVECLHDIPSDRIAWISLGTFRYTANLKQKIGKRKYLFNEFVPCNDGKYRYLQRIRTKAYARMYEWIKEACNAPVYLCMESPAVWRKIFGKLPKKLFNLCAIFNRVKL